MLWLFMGAGFGVCLIFLISVYLTDREFEAYRKEYNAYLKERREYIAKLYGD